MLIAPSILSADFGQLKNDLEKVKNAGADLLHIDIMDGQFVPNISLGIPVMEAINTYSDLPKDVHLMINNPENFIKKFIELGADYVTVHPESTEQLDNCLEIIKSNGAKAGIALNPETSFEVVLPYIHDIDLLLFMTINPGFGGQKFIHSVVEKMSEANRYRELHKLNDLLFEVDGGINEYTAKICRENKIDILVSGSTIFESKDIKNTMNTLRNS
ncbi:ribulose-phosphate 3-epimerase [Metabacillus halosaccharovorans]|uniref:ribulose-phosphate 3-epimerase n=1 Tax=Metabacillus halosaccharovorans TaxID=930124 RepID=UPI0020A6E470|nr:ribulose-phosphate 3-epimerase [Metabacillus halosaccharovorans]MBU7592829.1 ribulose-phosphate 3-epimerase [Metabacillus halosaccharovorans]